MLYKVLFIFITFIIILSIIRLISVDNFSNDHQNNNVYYVTNTMLDTDVNKTDQCDATYIEQIATKMSECAENSDTEMSCKQNAHIEASKNISICLGIELPTVEQIVIGSRRVEVNDNDVVVSAQPEVDVMPTQSEGIVPPVQPPSPCNKLNCYKTMLDYQSRGQEFNSRTDFADCTNCTDDRMHRTDSTFTELDGVTVTHVPYDWSDPVTYPGDSSDNYSNYCKWGLVQGWCNETDFQNACVNECP